MSRLKSAIFIFVLQDIHLSAGYYASPSKASFFDASHFCQDQCSSDAASIHSLDDYLDALYQARNITYEQFQNGSAWMHDDIWFGLTAFYDGDNYAYQDVSRFDYGNSSVYSLYPWDDSTTPPSDRRSVKINSNNLWEDADSYSEHRFLCNSCDGVTNKYIIHNSLSTWSEARTYCQTAYGTDLASFHSARDIDEGDALCGNEPCWIGLNDISTEGQYVWSDGSSFVYGSDVSGGVEPWDELQPNATSNGDCVSLHEYNGGGVKTLNALWRVSNCGSTRKALCAMPNELCAFKSSSWLVLQGAWSPNDCVDITFNQDTSAVITDKVWNNAHTKNGDNILVIEYMFLLQSVSSNTNSAGVMIYNMPALCDYYFVYVSFNPNAVQFTLTISKFTDGSEQPLISKTISMGLYLWTTLHIEVTNGAVFTVYANSHGGHIEHISTFSDEPQSIVDDARIGVKNQGITMKAKSLYISGTISLQSNDVASSMQSQCSSSLSPTAFPSVSSSISPTLAPTAAPSLTSHTPTIIASDTEPPSITSSVFVAESAELKESTSSSLNDTTADSKTEHDDSKTVVFAIVAVCVGLLLIVSGMVMVAVHWRNLKRKAKGADSSEATGSNVEIGHGEAAGDGALAHEAAGDHNDEVPLEMVVNAGVHLGDDAQNDMEVMPMFWRQHTGDTDEELYVEMKRVATKDLTRDDSEALRDDGNPHSEGINTPYLD